MANFHPRWERKPQACRFSVRLPESDGSLIPRSRSDNTLEAQDVKYSVCFTLSLARGWEAGKTGSFRSNPRPRSAPPHSQLRRRSMSVRTHAWSLLLHRITPEPWNDLQRLKASNLLQTPESWLSLTCCGFHFWFCSLHLVLIVLLIDGPTVFFVQALGSEPAGGRDVRRGRYSTRFRRPAVCWASQ